MAQWDQLTGEESSTPARQQRKQPKPKQPWGSRQERITSRQEQRSASNAQPEEVSTRTWSIAQFWLQEGERTYGQRPPVNLAEFSRRLQNRILESPEVMDALTKDDRHPEETGPDYVEDLVMEMVTFFWDSRERGEGLHPGLQFTFLVDEWERLEDRAKTRLRVRRILRNPHRVTSFEVAKDKNPYLLAVAASNMSNYIQTALSEDVETPAKSHRKRTLKKPSQRAV